jgi:hypothetical protein
MASKDLSTGDFSPVHLADRTWHANVFFFRTLERAKVSIKQANIPLGAAAN